MDSSIVIKLLGVCCNLEAFHIYDDLSIYSLSEIIVITNLTYTINKTTLPSSTYFFYEPVTVAFSSQVKYTLVSFPFVLVSLHGG